MTRPEWLIPLALVMLAFLAAVALFTRRRASSATAAELCRSFGLDPARYRVLGADVGGFAVPFNVRADGLIGRPDAVFSANDGSEVVVGEVKARLHKGRVSLYEQYQMILYLGAVRAQLRTQTVRGLIRYRDRVVDAPYCPQTYRHLLSMRRDCQRALASG